MKSLWKQQVRFLDELAKGEKTAAAVLSDLGLTHRHFSRWMKCEMFCKALEEVKQWLGVSADVDARVVVVARLRRGRALVTRAEALNGAERSEARDVFREAQRLDPALKAGRGKVSPEKISPIHPRFSATEMRKMLDRMEALRRKAQTK